MAIRSWTEDDGLRVYVHETYLDPDVHTSDTDTALLHWAERRTRQLAQKDATRAVYGTNAAASQKDRIRLLTTNGYRAASTLVEMELASLRDLPTPPDLSERYIIRAATDDDLRALWELNEIAYRDRAFISTGDEDYAEFRDNNDTSNVLAVATSDNELVAFVSRRVQGTDAEILEVSAILLIAGRDWRELC